MSGPLILAIDSGGTAVKVVVFDTSGRVERARTADIRNDHLPGGLVERDPEEFWQATAQTVREVTQGLDPARIVAVGCTGFGNGVFMADENGRATRPGIVSVDHRAQPLVDSLVAEGLAEELSAISGNRLWGGQTLMQLAHLSREEPEMMARSRWALACKDFIRLRLTGEALTDPTDASGGALMDPAAGEYGRSLFDALDMPGVVDKLPPIVGNSAIAGHVRADVAGNLGLAAGTPVAGSMMDVAACALGAGVLDDRRMVMIAGTWSINAVEVSGALPDGPPPILNMLHRNRACRLVAEGSPSSAANLGWYLKQALGDRVSADQASSSVAATPVESRRCHFLPFIYGPKPRRGAFVDLGADDDEGTMLRAIFEGVAFQHRVHAEHVLQHAGAPWPGSIRLAGGAARSPQWAQVFADICQRPVEVAQAEDVGALGAAICAAVAGGIYGDLATAATAMTHLGRTHEPNQRLSPFYEERFEEFLRLDQGMMGLFERSGADRSRRPTNTTGRERT